MLEGSADFRVGRDRLALHLVALHNPEGEAESERGVRIDRVAFVFEQCLGDQRVVGSLHTFDLVFPLLANCAGIGVDDKGQLDHRVVTALDHCLARLG